jgi:DMATS type aromatic prenyltransferase
MSLTGASLSRNEPNNQRSFQKAAEQQLRALCAALGWHSEAARMLAVQRLMFEGWGDLSIQDQPAFPSQIGDDHSPYEYSLAFQRTSVDVRLLCEAQDSQASVQSSLTRAEHINQRLAECYPVDFSRYESVADLFLRPQAEPSFLLWHGVSLALGQAPEFKVYFNPQVAGRAAAKALVAEALGRLHISPAVARFVEAFSDRCAGADCTYFSLDLLRGARARVKIYFAHPHARASELDRAFATVPSHRSGDVTHFCKSVMGTEGPFLQKPLTSCLSFVEGSIAPTGLTLHAPVAHYLSDDAVAFANISSYMSEQGLPVERYRAAIEAFASRPLVSGAGIHSYASIRRERSGMRVTTYLSPELYDTGESRSCVYSKLI